MISTQSSIGKPGFSSAADSQGPVAGLDPIIGSTRRKKYASLGVGSRKRWINKN